MSARTHPGSIGFLESGFQKRRTAGQVVLSHAGNNSANIPRLENCGATHAKSLHSQASPSEDSQQVYRDHRLRWALPIKTDLANGSALIEHYEHFPAFAENRILKPFLMVFPLNLSKE